MHQLLRLSQMKKLKVHAQSYLQGSLKKGIGELGKLEVISKFY